MEKIGKYNNLSPELRKKLRHLQPSEKATFELLNYQKDHLTGRPLYGGMLNLPGRDRIRDGNEFVDIAVPRVVEGDKILKAKKFTLGGGADEKVSARFDLFGDNIEHCEWYLFFQLCNYNASNENANAGTQKLIREIDFVAEARKEMKAFDTKYEALSAAKMMDADEARMVAAALNFDSTAEIEVVRAQLSKYADQNPKVFLELSKNPHTKDKAYIRLAIDNGVLQYDPGAYTLSWVTTGNLAIKMEKKQGKDHLQSAIETLAFMKDGLQIMKKIRDDVDKKMAANVTVARKNRAGEGGEK